MPEPETFICERCGEEEEDASFQPLCTECYHETEGAEDD